MAISSVDNALWDLRGKLLGKPVHRLIGKANRNKIPLYTRWQIKPLLDRNCIDWIQSDPDWCGGISEWLRICDMARRSPGVHVVPHSDNILADCQCVASQPESLCPMLEFNAGQTASKLSLRTRILQPDVELLTMPQEPGLGPDIDLKKCKRI